MLIFNYNPCYFILFIYMFQHLRKYMMLCSITVVVIDFKVLHESKLYFLVF